jgi:hypothetical protein
LAYSICRNWNSPFGTPLFLQIIWNLMVATGDLYSQRLSAAKNVLSFLDTFREEVQSDPRLRNFRSLARDFFCDPPLYREQFFLTVRPLLSYTEWAGLLAMRRLRSMSVRYLTPRGSWLLERKWRSSGGSLITRDGPSQASNRQTVVLLKHLRLKGDAETIPFLLARQHPQRNTENSVRRDDSKSNIGIEVIT